VRKTFLPRYYVRQRAAKKNQQGFTPALLRSASGDLRTETGQTSEFCAPRSHDAANSIDRANTHAHLAGDLWP